MKIEDNPAPVELDKRFYPPFKIVDDCPTCGKEAVACDSDAYLSYPWVNKAEEIYFYCGDCEEADRNPVEWSKFIIIRITAEECRPPSNDL